MARPREFDEAEVVAKAMDLFWVRGYRDTTPKALLDATGLSKSSLYNTFGSKDGLFERAFADYLDSSIALIDAQLGRGPLRAAFAALFDSGIRLGSPEGGRTCLVCSTTIQAEPDQELLVALVQDAHDQMRALFARHLARGQQEGSVRTDRSAEDLAAFMLNTSMGLQVLARSNPAPAELRPVAELALEAVFV